MKKIFVLSGIWIIALMTFMLPVKATESEVVILTLSSPELIIGDTFYLSISQTSSQGIIGLEGNLQYDKNALELAGTEMKQSWIDYGEGSLVSAISDEPITLGDVCTIAFKVKKDIQVNEISIGLTNAKVYRDYDDYSETTVEPVKASVSGLSSPNELVKDSEIHTKVIVGIIAVVVMVFVIAILIMVKIKNNSKVE